MNDPKKFDDMQYALQLWAHGQRRVVDIALIAGVPEQDLRCAIAEQCALGNKKSHQTRAGRKLMRSLVGDALEQIRS